MTVSAWIAHAERQLKDVNIATSRLDCLVLLEDVTSKNRAWLLTHPEHVLPDNQISVLNAQIAQRATHTPLAYIRGKVEFYGYEFLVNTYTLVPRPETEIMIDLLKNLALPIGSRLLDIGTGSGCIAITAALELPGAVVSGSDIDPKCLEVATKNAKILGGNVSFFVDDLLAHLKLYDVLLTNLPYVPDDFHINPAAAHEPHRALFGGRDGLDLYRKLFEQLKANAVKPRYVLTESLPLQHEKLAVIAKVAGFTLRQSDDFIQLFESI